MWSNFPALKRVILCSVLMLPLTASTLQANPKLPENCYTDSVVSMTSSSCVNQAKKNNKVFVLWLKTVEPLLPKNHETYMYIQVLKIRHEHGYTGFELLEMDKNELTRIKSLLKKGKTRKQIERMKAENSGDNTSLEPKCLVESMTTSINEAINKLSDFYGDVPSSIDCASTKNKVEKLTCSTAMLSLMEKLDTKAYVYAVENGTKQEVDHKNTVDSDWIKNIRNKAENGNKLCGIYIEHTNNSLGSSSPYYTEEIEVTGGGSSYLITYNDSGAILKSETSETLYLGKDCDAFSKGAGKGSWGHTKNGFLVALQNDTIHFAQQEINVNNSNCNM